MRFEGALWHGVQHTAWRRELLGPESQADIRIPIEWLSGARLTRGRDDNGELSVKRGTWHVKVARPRWWKGATFRNYFLTLPLLQLTHQAVMIRCCTKPGAYKRVYILEAGQASHESWRLGTLICDMR